MVLPASVFAAPIDLNAVADLNACELNNTYKNIDDAFKGPGIAGGVCLGSLGDKFVDISDATFSGDVNDWTLSPRFIVDEVLKFDTEGFLAGVMPQEVLDLPLFDFVFEDTCTLMNDFADKRVQMSTLDFPDLFGADVIGTGCVSCDSSQVDDIKSPVEGVQTFAEVVGDGDCGQPIESAFPKVYLLDGTEVDNGLCLAHGCFYKDGACTRSL